MENLEISETGLITENVDDFVISRSEKYHRELNKIISIFLFAWGFPKISQQNESINSPRFADRRSEKGILVIWEIVFFLFSLIFFIDSFGGIIFEENASGFVSHKINTYASVLVLNSLPIFTRGLILYHSYRDRITLPGPRNIAIIESNVELSLEKTIFATSLVLLAIGFATAIYLNFYFYYSIKIHRFYVLYFICIFIEKGSYFSLLSIILCEIFKHHITLLYINNYVKNMSMADSRSRLCKVRKSSTFYYRIMKKTGDMITSFLIVSTLIFWVLVFIFFPIVFQHDFKGFKEIFCLEYSWIWITVVIWTLIWMITLGGTYIVENSWSRIYFTIYEKLIQEHLVQDDLEMIKETKDYLVKLGEPMPLLFSRRSGKNGSRLFLLQAAVGSLIFIVGHVHSDK